jgi:hypothetical protein
MSSILLFVVSNVLFLSILLGLVHLLDPRRKQPTTRGARRMTKDEYAVAWQRWANKQRATSNVQRQLGKPQRSNLTSRNISRRHFITFGA